MNAYKPFPIADFDVGEFSAKQPWLSPKNTFQEIENGHVYRGRLKSRPGFQTYGGLGTAVATETVSLVSFGSANSFDYVANSVANAGVIAPYKVNDTTTYRWQMSVYVDGAEEIYYDTGQKITTWPVTGQEVYQVRREGDSEEFTSNLWGFVIRDTGTFLIGVRDTEAITSHPSAATGGAPHNGIATYDYLDGDAVMGISTYQDSSASDVTLAASETNLFRWNTSSEKFEKLSLHGSVTISGSDSNFFWFEPFGADVFIVNGNNRPMKYDSTASPPVVLADTDYTGSGAYFRSAKACVRYKGRLLYFAIDDDGTGVKQGRVRWTQVGNPEGWDRSTDYIDAPTNDAFVTVRLLGDRILVGFSREWWELESTQDPLDPFRWVRIPSEEGAVSLHGGVSFAETVVFRSPVSVSGIDGMGQRAVDDTIPDEVRGWNAAASEYTNAVRYDQLRQVWFTYAQRGDDVPNHILVMQREPGGGVAWSRWVFAGVHSFGDTRNASNLLLDDVYETFDEIAWSFDSPDLSADFPQVLVGKRDGSVWIVTSDADDDGSDIAFSATSQRLSPFPGQRTRFGHLDVMADAAGGGTLKLSFRRDYESGDLFSETIDLTPEGTEEKVIRRVPVNVDATFLTVRMDQTARLGLSVDMLELWAKPSGVMREVS